MMKGKKVVTGRNDVSSGPFPEQVQYRAAKTSDLNAINLSFLKQRYPDIFKRIESYSVSKSRLARHTLSGKLDVYQGGHSLYQGDMYEYCRKEVDMFSERFSEGHFFTSTKASTEAHYDADRFFNLAIKKSFLGIDTHNSEYQKRVGQGQYSVPNFYSVLVVFSIGLHIEELMNRKDIRHLIVVESNFENVIHSLNTINWRRLHDTFSCEGRSVNIVIIKNTDLEKPNATLWNVLNRLTPLFPLQTFFYNHRGLKKYTGLIELLKKDVTVNYFQWGNYDDEINQFNNALHNLSSDYNVINHHSKHFIDVPVCVVGSGPSLDDRVEDLKEIRDKCILMSCGTALQALHYHGIEPDFHVEIESHYATYSSCIHKLESDDPGYLKNITLLASVQVTPKVCSAFRTAILYFKDSSALSYIFSNPKDKIKNMTPTCTNAAMAICKYLDVKDVLLFGCDMGFHSHTHHAKGSIYYDKNASDYIKKHTKDQESQKTEEYIGLKSVHGQLMYTSGIYYTALRCLENAFVDFKGRVYNCSEGAIIKYSTYLSSKDVSLFYGALEKSKCIKGIRKSLIASCTSVLSDYKLDVCIQTLNEQVSLVCRKMLEIMSEHPCYDMNEAVFLASNLMAYLEGCLETEYAGVYYLLRGSVWHFLHIVLSHGMAEHLESDFYVKWHFDLSSFLNTCPLHCKTVLSKAYPDMQDPWVNDSFHDVGEVDCFNMTDS